MTPTQMNFEYILIKIFIYFAFLLSPKRLVQLKRARAQCLNSLINSLNAGAHAWI